MESVGIIEIFFFRLNNYRNCRNYRNNNFVHKIISVTAEMIEKLILLL